MNCGKTLYVLGAGFSVAAGAPTQNKILEHSFRLRDENPDVFDKDLFSIFENYIEKQLNIPESLRHSVDLEDIFTPLDRCLAENSQFRGLGPEAIMQVRSAGYYVVARTLEQVLNHPPGDKRYINHFAEYLTACSMQRISAGMRKNDSVSVLSTNWDILLDNSIYQSIQRQNETKGVVDYCCYISSLDSNDETVKPGLEILGQGGYNVKLLKLHGSLNWLQCSRCARLYVKFGDKVALSTYYTKQSCRHCDHNFTEEAGKHLLAANLIMPTYLKDLSNPQYRIIWQNAGIEIAEASKIVFIGYSLPMADFEFRQLLSRMTRANAEIEVVDFCTDDDNKRSEIAARWQKFFGRRSVKFHFDGAEQYLFNLNTVIDRSAD